MIKQALMGLESWSLQLDPRTPQRVMDRLDPRVSGGGQVVITTEHHLHPGDELLSLARFAGILLEQRGDFGVGGAGMAWYLGDQNGIGTYFQSVSVGGAGNFSDWAAALTPPGLTTGVVTPGLSGHPYTYSYMTLKEVLADVMRRFGTEWRVRPTGAVDFGYRSTIFRITDPNVLIIPNSSHSDLDRSTLPGNLQIDRDIKDYVRGVRLLSSDGTTQITPSATGGIADIDVPYRAFDGSVIKRDKAIRASGDVTGFEATLANAEFEKNRYPRQEFSLSTDHYTIAGDLECGDMVRVYDGKRGIQDLANRMVSGGSVVYPETLRCVGLSWPVVDGYGVYLRRFVKNGSVWEVQWTDLTEYVNFESGPTTIDLGSRTRPINRP